MSHQQNDSPRPKQDPENNNNNEKNIVVNTTTMAATIRTENKK